MKLSTVATIVALSSGIALARPPHQRHHHARQIEATTSKVSVDTVVVFEYQGHSISAKEVQEGIANGTLVYASNGAVMPAKSESTAPSQKMVPSGSSTSSSSTTLNTPASAPSASASADAAQQSAPTPAASSLYSPDTTTSLNAAPTSGPPNTDSTPWPSAPSPQGINDDFPDGQIDCSDFPAQYGAVALDYLGLGGWSGIQCPGFEGAQGFADIQTKTSGATCGENDFCSYACPAGYEKTQWPATQGSTGQSIGGLQCVGGKLRLTNSGLSSKLCSRGSTQVAITVQNTMNEGVAICRTDYPGTEGEVIPLQANPGQTTNLTCPDAAHYYNWQGKSTSAQYYVNPKGVSPEQGCQWGNATKNWGNFAPLNLGVGYSNGAAWLSILQNLPTTNVPLDFSVEIVGDNGGYDNLVGRCKYENGQYCSGEEYEQQAANGNGCTVSASI
ncbi:MAG: hypothetical protein Q9159_006266 [Coniocarpon cinnabarinum]